ncbi:MAG: hypothetical protein IPJ47_17470 [Anaerolineales bacterium]|nr:hypothetical protein [Anaerolineales bacterium]
MPEHYENTGSVRNAKECRQDIPTVAEIELRRAFSYGTAEKPKRFFQLRLTAFPDGFIILIADNEIATYGCSEKWLTEREPGLTRIPCPLINQRADPVHHRNGCQNEISGSGAMGC